jgi:signal transduction histidine kinase
VRTITPTKRDGENLELRTQLSNLQGLLVLAMLMIESTDEGQILHLATSSVGGLARCRPEGVYLTGQGWRWTAGSFRQETGRRAVERQLAGLGSLGGAVEVPGRSWGWAYPLRSLAGGVSFLIVSAEEAPGPAEQFLLRVMVQQAGMALANARLHAQEHATAEGLADEQAALRRVATLVAEAARPPAVFAAVAEEVGRLLVADHTIMVRYEADDTVTVVAAWSPTGDTVPVGLRRPLLPASVSRLVRETGRPARFDPYAGVAAAELELGIRSAVGAPITVQGRLWGLMTVASTSEEPLPVGTDERLAAFTELVATAIANAQAREELRGFAEEQAALRRVATLVARAAPPEEVFAAVTAEVGRVLSADVAGMSRYDSDGAATVVGVWTSTGAALPVPGSTRLSPGGRNVTALVFETGRPARIDDYADASGPAADLAREEGLRASVGVPITVEGRLWGVVMVSSRREPLRADTEARLAGFTELVGTALANTEAQAALTTSRARIVSTADHTRRRIERDLHDGAQQQLVSLALQLWAAQAAVPPELEELQAELDHVAAGLTGVQDELREFARGIHPAVLAEGGLGPALRTLARRCSVPVQLRVGMEGRLPERVEVTAYYVVAEALTNVAKHAGASLVQVQVDAEDGLVRVSVRDDGVGGADPDHGSGLVGLKDRVEATGGTLRVESRLGQGTRLLVELPIDAGQPPDST